MNYSELLRLLLPYDCYSDSDLSTHAKDIAVHAGRLNNLQENADALHSEIYPNITHTLLPAWERVYNIIPYNNTQYEQRINNLLTAIRGKGELSKEYFISLATRLGYQITIEEFVPFMAGWSEAGDEIYIEDIIYIWEVIASNTGMSFFEAGIACAGDSLGYVNDSDFENIFNRLKPAHTLCVFNYQ